MTGRIARWAAALIVLAGPAGAAVAPSQFDRPLRIERVALPRDADNPQAKPQVTCYRYRDFLVKEVDLGEVGADQLSILPGAPPSYRCQRQNAVGERVIPGAQWTGYFAGAKGGFVVFNAEDGWQDGLGFAVFDAASGAKRLDDAAKGGFSAIEASPGRLKLRYVRVYAAKCSLRADAHGCWRRIRAATGLTGQRPPDCAAAYAREARRRPKFAAKVRTDPTVIDYEAVAQISATGAKIRPLSGRALACRPSE
jgi:hypothetical protein